MTLVNKHEFGSMLRATIAWVVEPGDTITDTTLTCTHDDGETVVDVPTEPGDDPNEWTAELQLPRPGRWHFKWTTSPPGGAYEATVYCDA